MARMHYPLAAVRWNHTFADILTQLPDGRDYFDYRRFHDVEPLDLTRAVHYNGANPDRMRA